MWRVDRLWHSMAIKCMCKRQDIYSSSSGLGTRLVLVQARTKQPAWIYRPIKALETLTLTRRLKMEERVATSLDHSLILEYRVLCDDQSTFAFICETSHLSYSNQGVSKLPTWLYWHARTFDVSACVQYLQRTTLLLLVDVLTVGWQIVQLNQQVTCSW